ncbi:MAG TPA: arsenic transporter [Steroidobacteraceae bacterium]|jgi:arsenical pump membrane protein|nr:arsenic transporter [Steroidobacteraceae bacterium]
MDIVTLPNEAVWLIAALATLGVMIRPWGLPEAIWAVGGAVLLVAAALLPWGQALAAVAAGTNVYLFLVGMMLLAELARAEGLFEWLAALAARRARGSPRRLFTLVYAVGALVTMLLSNDATAVVLTPAVYAVARVAEAEPLPYLFICAFIANAASFTLPISNPANLVVFANHMPPLASWLGRFALPSAVAIIATYALLRLSQCRALQGTIRQQIGVPPLSGGARLTAGGILLTAAVLLAASSAGVALGPPTFAAGVLTTLLVLLRQRRSPRPVLRGVSWSVLPLVAGLFVLVRGLEHTGVLAALSALLQADAHRSAAATAWGVGVSAALACNLANNLPVALVAGTTLQAASAASPLLANAMLIGVDLGPNLSITGSLATILWMVALRREQQQISAGRFLRLGALVMLPALLLSLAAALLQR